MAVSEDQLSASVLVLTNLRDRSLMKKCCPMKNDADTPQNAATTTISFLLIS